MAAKWLKPWMVALALAVAGVAGATAVLFAARAQHARDRRDVRVWSAATAPFVTRLRTDIGVLDRVVAAGRPGVTLPAGADAKVAAARADIAALRNALSPERAPAVVGTVAEAWEASAASAGIAADMTERSIRVAPTMPMIVHIRMLLKSSFQDLDTGKVTLAEIRCKFGAGNCS